jgi:hypothetical protein
MGSIQQESTFNPYAKEKGGTGRGLFQWSYDRTGKMPTSTGNQWKDIDNQLAFFQQELATTESKAGGMLKSAKTLQQAGSAMKQYERYGTAGDRYKYMQQWQNAGSGGGGLSGGKGMSGEQLAGSLGNYIKQTGGAPGSIHEHPWHGGVKYQHSKNSYHKSGRAIDIGAYANEQAGVISRIKAFNSKMGVRPVEFLHAGNDSKHQDHVHVAYAYGAGMPAFFNSQRAAVNWERSMMPAGASVRSVTSNTSEGLGGAMVTAPITINAGSGQNAKEIAAEVIFELNRAVTEVRAASLYG